MYSNSPVNTAIDSHEEFRHNGFISFQTLPVLHWLVCYSTNFRAAWKSLSGIFWKIFATVTYVTPPFKKQIVLGRPGLKSKESTLQKRLVCFSWSCILIPHQQKPFCGRLCANSKNSFEGGARNEGTKTNWTTERRSFMDTCKKWPKWCLTKASKHSYQTGWFFILQTIRII